MHSTTDNNPESILSRFFVVGINYRHATVTERSLFSITSVAHESILKTARERGMRSLFSFSTCNRTEIYAYCHNGEELLELLLSHTQGTNAVFEKAGFIKNGSEALAHLFQVAAGLDSQIVGDYEVLAQLKATLAVSRKHDMIGPVMDRTINFVLQASKSVRTHTKLSTGTVSVSYAAIEWLRKIDNAASKKILLIGTGKFGSALARNIRLYFPSIRLTIVNRTDEVACTLASSLSVQWRPFVSLKNEVKKADILIVSTNSPEYTLLNHYFDSSSKQWVLDLSVPENVDPRVKDIAGVQVTGIDEVSAEMKANLARRADEVPRAVAIVEEHQRDFYEWLKMQKHVPLINKMKDKLYQLGELHFCEIPGTEILNSRVNKTVGSLAMNLRYKTEKGCHYINAINEFLQPDKTNG